MSEDNTPAPNVVDVTVKKFSKHMVEADYHIVLQSTVDSVETLISRIKSVRSQVEI